MIEVVEVLQVSKEQFFNQLLYSVQMEIQDVTGKKVTIENIQKGFTYTKNMKTKVNTAGDVKVTLDDVIMHQLYKMRVVTSKGDTCVEYQIKEIDPNQIEVTYKEDFEPATKTLGWNYKLMSFFYIKKGKKRISTMLKVIEQYIIENNEVQSI